MRRIVLPAEPLVDGATALRGWRESDIAALVVACRDPEIVRWTRVPERYGEADARAYMLQRYDAIQAGTAAPFAVVAAEELERLLGSISLMRFDWLHRRAEVGYWLAREARGHGHAARSVQLICAWAFSVLELERIDLLAATTNPASQRVAERAGFRREAVLRSYMLGKGERHDMVAFGLLAADERRAAADERRAAADDGRAAANERRAAAYERRAAANERRAADERRAAADERVSAPFRGSVPLRSWSSIPCAMDTAA